MRNTNDVHERHISESRRNFQRGRKSPEAATLTFCFGTVKKPLAKEEDGLPHMKQRKTQFK